VSGRIIELSALRYTPTVKAEIPAVAFQAQARLIAAARPGSEVKLEGFLGAKSQRSKKNVLHVTNIEFVEGK
jgi:primosomal replication protein N